MVVSAGILLCLVNHLKIIGKASEQLWKYIGTHIGGINAYQGKVDARIDAETDMKHDENNEGNCRNYRKNTSALIGCAYLGGEGFL